MEDKVGMPGDTRGFDALVSRENLERKALSTLTTDTLNNLNISIEALPHKCQHILQQVAKNQLELDLEQLDPISINLLSTKHQTEIIEEEYEILKLKQKNEELQMKIDRNNKFIDEMKDDLKCSKQSLASQDPNPDNVQDYIRQLKTKLASYEDNCEKAQNKLTVLAVPDAILPKSLTSLMTTLASLREEAAELKLRADDVRMIREARDTFNRLRR
ncbi:uncharacterized protein LOC121737750 isoform X1 [Aricia agestis]|uniref:uncharacterized protein LOC121737750 isoform X1 n=1 Tax=Aricia agestis TaxID=91739 RepID=UPI001C208768|nr:uncharacterized protein LOC121737750 isoform X1 [Aricia agestis]